MQHVPATLYQEEYNKFTVAFLSCSNLQQIFAGRFKQDFNILRKMQLLEESDVLWPEFLRAGLQIGLSVKGFGSICVFSNVLYK